MKKKIGVCGNFSGKTPKMGGQTVKTHNTYRALEETYGAENICCVNTYDWKKKTCIRNDGCCKIIHPM